jgi:hypothetical protein
MVKMYWCAISNSCAAVIPNIVRCCLSVRFNDVEWASYTAWRLLVLPVEDTASKICKVAVKILNKQSRTADKGGILVQTVCLLCGRKC